MINYLKNGDYIRLLGQSSLSHYHRELRTSVLFNQILKEKLELSADNYGEMKSDDACYILVPTNGIDIKIIFDYNRLEFVFYEKLDDTEVEISKEKLKSIDENLYQLIYSMECNMSTSNLIEES